MKHMRKAALIFILTTLGAVAGTIFLPGPLLLPPSLAPYETTGQPPPADNYVTPAMESAPPAEGPLLGPPMLVTGLASPQENLYPVPEPSTPVLFAIGIALLIAGAWRRRVS
jgi:hypothetical protein